MLLIPAIDLKDGRCVQLRQGVMESASVYADDPAVAAERWRDAGARRLHVVDLDGAFAGQPMNRARVEAIVEAVGGAMPVQVGGGIRSLESAAAYFDAGASQVIAGTRALEDAAFLRALAERHPGAIILGLDAHDGRIATRGWTARIDQDALQFVAALGDLPLHSIVYTDIARDGMLAGINAAATGLIAEATRIPVIASGGVGSLDDLRALKALNLPAEKLLGAISGTALYEGAIDFEEGQRLLDG